MKKAATVHGRLVLEGIVGTEDSASLLDPAGVVGEGWMKEMC